jgi:hypothetical protein
MGNRSNIVIKQHDGSRVWLYGHWMGEDSINVVRDVLAQRERWNDAPYLARMLFTKMTAGDTGSTGFGISTYMNDNENPVIVLDPETQTVVLEDAPWGSPLVSITPEVSFETFISCGSEYSPTFADVAVDMGAVLVAS